MSSTRRKYRVLAAIVTLCLAASLGAQPQPRSEPVLLVPPSPADRIDPNAYSFYVNGLLASGFGEMEEAVLWFKRAYDRSPDSYEIGYALAESYLQIRKPDMALEILLQIHPRNVPVYHLSAIAYRMIGEDESAHGIYLKILGLDSSDVGALRNLAMNYRRQDHQDSLLFVYELLLRNATPYDAAAWAEVGRLRSNAGDTSRALQAFARSFDLDSSRANVPWMLFAAYLYGNSDKLDSCGLLLHKALRMDPENWHVHRDLALFYSRLDSLTPLLYHQQELVRLRPEDSREKHLLALTYWQMDSVDVADSIMNALVESGEMRAEYHLTLADLAYTKRDLKRAREQYHLAITANDTTSAAWDRLSQVYFLLGDSANCEKTLRIGLQRVTSREGLIKLKISLGSILERRGATQESLSLYEEVLPQDPENPHLLNNLGYTLALLGERLEYALTLTTKAVAIEPNNGAYLDSHGWVLHLLGRSREGLDYLLKAAELTPDATVFEHIGDVYSALRELTSARQWWQKALELAPKNKELAEKVRQE